MLLRSLIIMVLFFSATFSATFSAVAGQPNAAMDTTGTAENACTNAATGTTGTTKDDMDKGTGTLKINNAWARPSISSNNNSVVYCSIDNLTQQPITILAASAPLIANNVELHKSFVDENGVSRMTSVDKIIVPANSTIALTPGGIHVMLLDLKKQLKTGDDFKINFAIKGMQPIMVDVKVK